MPIRDQSLHASVRPAFWRRGCCMALLCGLLLPGPRHLSAQETAVTLQETLALAESALSVGDYSSALRFFETIQTTFGREPEVAEPSFQIVIVPLHAYAALLAEDTDTAIRLFEQYTDRFPDDRTRLAFVLFNLARAHEVNEDLDSAIDTYREFVALDPTRPEAALASLAAAGLMFETDRDDEAFATLDALQAREPPGVIRNKARLTALQKALDHGRTDLARHYMLSENWSIREMPELAVLAFAALEMGKTLLETNQYDDAVKCFRLVPPYPALIAAQEERLRQTRERFESRRQSVGLYQGGQFWTQFYNDLLARLEQQLAALRAAEDYTATLYLSLGQAYLLAGRAHEAKVLFKTLSRDEAMQSEAHYRWILAAIEVGVWEDAFRIAEAFGERFPNSPLVPDALYLLATAYQEARQYRDAVMVLDTFLADHGDHRLAARALFVRGYNYNLLNEPVLARIDFESFIAQYPTHALYLDSRFWRALTFFAERDYEQTLEALKALRKDVNGHRLEPEVAYREAATLYAEKDYEAALASILRYLESYPLHLRFQEARVLLGDIQMGRGQLTEARAIFASIEPSAGHLFMYAVFQTGKILRAVAGAEDRAETREPLLNAHLEHFEKYLERDDVPLKGRISEALYWIGWTHIEKGDSEMARAVFDRALEEYGDDIEADQVLNIIDALARIEKRLSGLGRKARNAALKEWIDSEKQAALATDRLTYYARLNFYLESMVPPDEPTSLIFETVETVPIERLDAEGLGRIASALVERYPIIAEDYLIRLEDDYPDSHHRAYAYYTRAVLLMKEGKFEQALTELGRFRSESPMHPLAIPVAMRYAECLTQTERFEQATEVLEEILRLRHAKGRPHAEALLALSRNEEAAGKIRRAIPYAQRVYNVYRAYPDLSAEAYWMSARQFEAIGDTLAAFNTLDEMLADPRIQPLPIAAQAEAMHTALKASLPEDLPEDPAAGSNEEQEVSL